MSDLNILQRRRSDGSLTLVGSTHRPDDEDKVFPPEFDFSLKRLGAGAWPATVEGDKITLEYANAKAVYKIDREAEKNSTFEGYHAVLESSEFFDAPPIDEEKRDALRAERDAASAEAAAPVADEVEEPVKEPASTQEDKF